MYSNSHLLEMLAMYFSSFFFSLFLPDCVEHTTIFAGKIFECNYVLLCDYHKLQFSRAEPRICDWNLV